MKTTEGPFSHNVSTVATTNLIIFILTFVSGTLVARLLGAQGRGELAAIQNFPMLIATIGTLGLPSAIVYFTAKEPAHAGLLLTSGIIIETVAVIPLMIIGYWLTPILLTSQNLIVISDARFFLMIIPVVLLGGLSAWVLQGLGELKLWNLLRLQMPVYWLAIIAIGWVNNTLTSRFLAYGFLIAMIINCIVFGWVVKRLISGPFQVEYKRVYDLLCYGLPSILALVPQQLNLRLDQLMMATILPAETLGIYAVAVTWSGALSPLLNSVAQVIFPRIAATHDRRVQIEIFQRMLRVSVVLSIGGVGGLFIATIVLFPLLFGTEFISAVPTALILILASTIANINWTIEEAIRGFGFSRLPLIAEFTGLGSTIFLLIIFLQKYQMLGAALVSLFSYSVTLCTLLYIIKHKMNINPEQYLFPRKLDFMLLWDQIKVFCHNIIKSNLSKLKAAN